MKAAIITIGDEILIGQIIDTNSAYIAKAFDTIGIQICEMLSIADERTQILETFAKLQNKVDLVVITGGLGPTKDDITKKTICDYFDDQLIMNPEVLQHVTYIIENSFKRPISQINKDQALVPSKSEILFNQYGTAPGMWIQKEQTVFVSLPGVPFEMKHLIDDVVVPKIVKNYKRPYILHKTILTYGIGESLLAEKIETWENNLPSFIKLAYLPSPGKVRLRLTARGIEKEPLEKALEHEINQLNFLIKEVIIGLEEEETIEVVLGKLLKQAQLTIATAESCTGGKIAEMLTSISGASNYFKGSVVCYATQSKIDVLKVSQKTIDDYSVVSKEVTVEMAQQAQKIFQTDYAIATTGNAGPNKGESDAEIGTVFIAIATPKTTFVEQFNFGQPREKVLHRTANKALEIVRKEILKNV